MPFLNFASPHVHIASLDSASTPEAFARREIELGTGTLTVTDHGTLQATRTVYDLCRKKFKGQLTPILGIEAYFRDDNCPILTQAGIPKNEDGSFVEFFKYGHFTMHALDEDAYNTIVRLLSDADSRAEQHGSERKPIFTWRDLEELGSKNITFGSGCLIGMVQRFIMEHGRFDLAEQYYNRFRSLVKPGNFYVEVFPHVCDRDWDSAVYVTLEDGSQEKYTSWKKLRTDKDEYKAKELVTSWKRSHEGHGCLRAVMQDRKWAEIEAPKKILNVELREGYIVNDCQPWAPGGDLQFGCNKAVMDLAARHGDKILISDDSHFSHPEDKVIQDIRLAQNGTWRFANSHYRYSSADAWKYFHEVLNIQESVFESWIANSAEWAQRFKDFKFKERQTLPVKFYPADTLKHTVHLIKKHGRMQDTPAHWDRLNAEIELLHRNGTIDLLPYFFLAEEALGVYERKGKLVGPGRGSAAGLSLAYYLGITHVDPMKFNLSKDRFLTIDRVQSGKMPDIDMDLPEREDTLIPWLDKRFGDHYAQISVDTTLKLKSSIKDVARWKRSEKGDGGFVPPEIEVLCKKMMLPPQGVTDHDFVFGYKGNDGWEAGSITYDPALQAYAQQYPEEWQLVQKCLGLSRQKGRHASAFVIANEPIKNFIPLTSVSEVTVTQFTAGAVEAAGGLKMDFLVVNALKDIGAAIRLIQERSSLDAIDWASAYNLPDDPNVTVPGMQIGHKFVPLLRIVPIKGEFVDIWDLPEDQEVFREICEGKTETVFQLNTPGAKKWLRQFDAVKSIDAEGTVHKALDSIEDLAAFTALDRPGPLNANVRDAGGQEHNMLVEFANRAKGKEAVGAFKILYDLIPETHAIITFQEQLTRIFREIGKSTAIEAENFRIHVSKKMPMEIIKDKDIFMKGAVGTVGEKAANVLWSQMETFGEYGFNKSHAVCYVIIGYACAWLKHHFPLEWWTAVLRNADRKEIEEVFWPHCGHLVDPPDINLSGDNFCIQNCRIRAPLSLIQGIGTVAAAELNANRPYKDLEEFCQKIQDKRNTVTVVNGKTKKGRSALHRGIVYDLICSGVMDSLFSNLESFEKLNLFEEIVAKLTKKKKPEPVDSFYTSINPLQRYQNKKQILAAYGTDLIPICEQMGFPWLSNRGNGRFDFVLNGRRYGVARASQLEILNHISPLPHDGLRAAAIAYVVSDTRQVYQGKKQMAKLLLDVEGRRQEIVKWPDKEGKLPTKFKEDLSGCIVVAIVSRYSASRPMVVDDVMVVQSKLVIKKEE